MIKKNKFTLIELIASMAIAVILITMLVKVFGSSTSLMSRKFNNSDFYATSRHALARITKDLEHLYSNQRDPSATPYDFSNNEILAYSYGAVEAPFGVSESDMASATAAPYHVAYSLSPHLSRTTTVLFASNSTVASELSNEHSGVLIKDESIQNFTVSAFYLTKDNQLVEHSGVYPTSYGYDSDNDGLNDMTIEVNMPYTIIIGLTVQDGNGNSRSFTKTIVTNSQT